MSHLSDQEITELLDDVLETGRAAHVGACAECRHRLVEASAALTLIRNVQIPEPSPLFWDHFSRRVSMAIAGEPAPPTASRWRLAWMPLTAMTILLAVVVGGMMWWSLPASVPVAQAPAANPTAAAIPADQEWVLVLDVAEDADWDAVVEEGLQVAPGSADTAALHLTVEERKELGRLLEAELSRLKAL